MDGANKTSLAVQQHTGMKREGKDGKEKKETDIKRYRLMPMVRNRKNRNSACVSIALQEFCDKQASEPQEKKEKWTSNNLVPWSP